MFANGLARELAGHNALTVPQAGWAGISNGRLLKIIDESGRFDLFLTVDKRLPEDNQTSELCFAIVLLRAQSNRMIHIFPFASEILRRAPEFQPGQVYALLPPD